jgi:hypothetical protein
MRFSSAESNADRLIELGRRDAESAQLMSFVFDISDEVEGKE